MKEKTPAHRCPTCGRPGFDIMPGSAFDPRQLDRPAITPPSPQFLAAFERLLDLAEVERLEREGHAIEE